MECFHRNIGPLTHPLGHLQDLMLYTQVGIGDLDLHVDEANRVQRHGGRLEGALDQLTHAPPTTTCLIVNHGL
jgi:hypothetical protein